MKKFIIVIIVTVALAMSAMGAESHRKRVTGSGNLSEKRMELGEMAGYEGIAASRTVKVVVSPDIKDAIWIMADDNLTKYVTVERDGKILRISIDNSIEVRHANITVTVPLTEGIRYLSASASATIAGKGAFTTEEMTVTASSAARIEAAVKCSTCDISASSAAEIMVAITSVECTVGASSSAEVEADLRGGECNVLASSAAEVTLTGEIDNGDFGASSAAEIDADRLKARTLGVVASSGGEIDVWCTERLNAGASSGAEIAYRGECKANITKSSGGEVRKRK